jgi:polysaccharide biosynthesis/export protein
MIMFVTSVFCAGALAQSRPTANVAQPGTSNNVGDLARDKTPLSELEGYIIGPEDVLSVNVWKEQELTTRVSVRPDGKIGLPLLNDVQASGFTPKQLQENLTRDLRLFVNNPQVSVIVLEIRSQNVYIIGGISKPGVYPLAGPMTIMELLVRAGGLAEFAKGEDIQILRTENSKQQQYRFNYKRFLGGKDYKQNIRLRSGDMVIVK